MAVTLFMRIPELTVAKYDRMMAGLELDASPPAGSILHIASESVGAVNVVEVWQTAQAAESFVQNRLQGAVRAEGVKEPLSSRIEPLYNMFAPSIDMIERLGAVSLPAGLRRAALAS
jgi:hypothetical protein